MQITAPANTLLYCIRIATNCSDAICHQHTTLTNLFQSFRRKIAYHRPTSNESTFFIGKNQHLQRVIGCHFVFIEYFNHFQCTKRSKSAIIVATIRHHVDVRTECNWLQCRIFSCPFAYDITSGINGGLKSGFLHQIHKPCTTFHITFGVSHAIAPTSFIATKSSECFNARFDTTAIYF